MLWDVFCRVIDNHGDLGVCWRLSADLVARGEQVRLWVDDASALRWMAPQGCPGVEVHEWPEAWPAESTVEPGDVVVEAFGCNPPDAFVARMQRPCPPVWINLEYLSAEDYVERSHQLMSPVFSGVGAGLKKWFFYPGFTTRTGGLLREPDLLPRRADFDRVAWLARHATAPLPSEQVVSLFCYRPAPVSELLAQLSTPTLLLVTPGIATELVNATLPAQIQAEQTRSSGLVRVHALPHFSQREFDALLWSCDVNFVRGEDSFVRAQWAGVPMVWNIYPQDDGVHAGKLDAFLRRYTAGANPATAEAMRRCWHWWNGLGALPAGALATSGWREIASTWQQSLVRQPDLTTQLLAFVQTRRTA
ncbi:elongation factor P maturation arginine rhamnosyltransferase EarP [Aquabacterium sp.]|uniref:elongation factor P maturation arginine rhamnosyltransferase EarP n=1 Tax=Aquabacterium sp. TaxID=1872578 RepID=UPI0035B4BE8E